MRFEYIGTGVATLTYLEFNVYAVVGSTFNVAADYTITIYLPQYYAAMSQYSPVGPDYNSVTTYAQCSSSFTVGITGYGTVANLNSLTFTAAQLNVRSGV